MYNPPHFKESEISVLHEAMRTIGFATLVSGNPELFVTHLPLLVDPEPAPYGTLIGHVARANDHWRRAAHEPVLAIFLGAHGYISPNWYASKADSGKVVPTWNYVAVHAHGTLRTFEDPERLRGVVAALTDVHEAGSAHPWQIGDAPAEFIDAQLKGIIGIEIPIARIEGKLKLSQNRSAQDLDGVIAGLRARGGEAASGLAAAIERARR